MGFHCVLLTISTIFPKFEWEKLVGTCSEAETDDMLGWSAEIPYIADREFISSQVVFG